MGLATGDVAFEPEEPAASPPAAAADIAEGSLDVDNQGDTITALEAAVAAAGEVQL